MSETWLLNEVLSNPSANITVEINFTSNNTQYDSITINKMPAWNFDGVAYGSENVYTGSDGWTNSAYRTLTFQTAPKGDLLTWLQANGTKQGVTPAIISFSIGGTTYQAEEGMTWSEWINSDDNTEGYTLLSGEVHITRDMYDYTVEYGGTRQFGTDVIVADREYYEVEQGIA